MRYPYIKLTMGSASQPMLVVKANRALLKKRKSFKEIRNDYKSQISETELNFKELTPVHRKRIRDKIIAQAKRDKQERIVMGFVAALLLLVLFYFLGVLFISLAGI